MTNRLTEVKRSFFQKRVSNASGTTPLGQLMKDYFNSILTNVSKTESIISLEKRFLQKIIVDNLGIISGNHLSELYNTANLTLGFRTFTRQTENEVEFYSKYSPA